VLIQGLGQRIWSLSEECHAEQQYDRPKEMWRTALASGRLRTSERQGRCYLQPTRSSTILTSTNTWRPHPISARSRGAPRASWRRKAVLRPALSRLSPLISAQQFERVRKSLPTQRPRPPRCRRSTALLTISHRRKRVLTPKLSRSARFMRNPADPFPLSFPYASRSADLSDRYGQNEKPRSFRSGALSFIRSSCDQK
jgi:hypothetical protein